MRTFFTQGWCLGSSGAVASKVYASMGAPALVTPSGVPKEQLETEAFRGVPGMPGMPPFFGGGKKEASQKLSQELGKVDGVIPSVHSFSCNLYITQYNSILLSCLRVKIYMSSNENGSNVSDRALRIYSWWRALGNY